ncbi:4-hydroxybenzoate polyprenyltransferase, mitochondrial [Eumeta japonica]|uniref:4-hydroxybenzoate polyprenyltransferase, mitochondrial n=1 Tax=Eumeta variegata TaxID=151549 RepID=A0A4C1TD34_EUMVA|nr:4-hydroxybenzoate polyprenyltransferase, mitochondrial [Eumeta japonica]
MSTKTSSINVRTRSSLSDLRKQKVVFESTDPKIVIEKIPNLKVLPDSKLEEKITFIDKLVIFRDKADPYFKLIRWDKPIGSWLLFWPCSWSITLASIAGSPLPSAASSLSTLGLFLAGSFVMRGAGCTINDLWDKDYDGQVARTRDRPLVSGAISQKQAVLFLAAQLSVGLTILLQLNWYSVILGASSMLLVIMYPLAKRFTDYPQIFLGATFNWGALLGWSAITGSIDPFVCLPLYAGALCWTVVYDTIYAHQDKHDDARIGIKSTALKFGERTKPLLSLWAGGALCGLSCAGAAAELDWPYYLALTAAAAHR